MFVYFRRFGYQNSATSPAANAVERQYIAFIPIIAFTSYGIVLLLRSVFSIVAIAFRRRVAGILYFIIELIIVRNVFTEDGSYFEYLMEYLRGTVNFKDKSACGSFLLSHSMTNGKANVRDDS